MNTLQELLMASLEKEVTAEKALHWIIVRKLAKAGIELTEEQFDKLTIELGEEDNDGKSPLIIEFDLGGGELEDQVKAALEQDEILITIEDIDEFDEVTKEVIQDVVNSARKDLAKEFLDAWVDIAPDQLAEEAKEEAEFNKRLHEIWGYALQKLRLLLSICLDAGATFNHEYRPAAVKDNDLVFEALVRLHSRGCQVGREILVLLNHGLADGALARWRTLHEISITADYIAHHGQDVAERYLLHQHIDNYKGMEQHQKHCRALGLKPYSVREMGQAKKLYDDLLAKFGNAYKGDYGWAATALNKSNPGFADIEEKVGLGHWRLYVKVAHHNVHATSRGNYYQLALPEDWELMVAGPSIFGLYEPSVQTAYSTINLLVSLLFSKITLDHIAIVEAVMGIANDVYRSFADALNASEREDGD